MQGISFGWLWEVGTLEIHIDPHRIQQITDNREMSHLLTGHKHECRRPSLRLLQDDQVRSTFEIDVPLAQRKCREKILATEPMLQLGRRAKCVNELFA